MIFNIIILSIIAAALFAGAALVSRKVYASFWIVAAISLVVANAIVTPTILGNPRPIKFEMFTPERKLSLISFTYVENEAIYLWGRINEKLQPSYYIIPWNKELAMRLQKQMDDKGAVIDLNKMALASLNGDKIDLDMFMGYPPVYVAPPKSKE